MLRARFVHNKEVCISYNRFRKKIFTELAPKDGESILYLLPWLLSVNDPAVPGYVPDLKSPIEIFGAATDQKILKRESSFKKIFGNAHAKQVLVSLIESVMGLNGDRRLREVTLLNPYEAIRLVGAARHLVRNVTGYPVWRGLYVDECYDIGRIENIHFWPFGVAYDPLDPYCLWINTRGVAFELARKRRNKVTSMDQRNVMKTGVLWNEVVTALHAREFKDVHLEHMLADAGGMQLVRWPKQFDVIVTDNLFGDVLSDEASQLTGSIGMLPSASLGAKDPVTGKQPALYEPVHGSAPDIAGKGIANPVGAILSAAMLLDHLGEAAGSERVRRAVAATIAAGITTPDLGGRGTTAQVTAAVCGLLT